MMTVAREAIENLTAQEKGAHEGRKKEKESLYGEGDYESLRHHLLAQYQEVEAVYNGYLEHKHSVAQLTASLGDAAFGAKGEHPSTQIYAYELLFKALAEAESPQDQERIVEEILFQPALETLPIKKEYLTGLLAYYGSHDFASERERNIAQTPGDAQLKDDLRIFERVAPIAKRLAENEHTPEEIRRIAELVVQDFPRGTPEGELARLVATYYEKDPRATRPPDPRTRRILDEITQHDQGPGGSGRPWYVYTLPLGHHTSRKKIEEGKIWGIELLTELTMYDPDRSELGGVIFDVDPAESMRYITEMRRIKDAEGLAAAIAYHNAYRDQLWQKLDEPARQFFERKGGVFVRVQTIRDYSLDQTSEEEEKIFNPGAVHPVGN